MQQQDLSRWVRLSVCDIQTGLRAGEHAPLATSRLCFLMLVLLRSYATFLLHSMITKHPPTRHAESCVISRDHPTPCYATPLLLPPAVLLHR